MGRGITLGQIAERTDVLVVACERCDMAERYPVASLIAQRGLKFAVPNLLRSLSRNCLKRYSHNHSDLCGICCPELPKLFPLSRHREAAEVRAEMDNRRAELVPDTESASNTDILTWSERQADLLRRIEAGEKVNDQVD